MSMSQPMEPGLPQQEDGIPAADAETGAPPPAEGFGVGGEEPDAPPTDEPPRPDLAGTELPTDVPFRTPDPTAIGPESGAGPES